MPRNVQLFAWLYFTSFLIGVIGGVLAWPAAWTAREAIIQSEAVAGVLAIFLMCFFPFFFLTVWRRKNWARWVLLVEFLGFLPLWFTDTGRGAAFPMLWVVVGFVSNAIEMLAFAFLFTTNAQPWFSRKSSK